MKLKTLESEFDELPVYNKLFLARWKEKKGYTLTKEFEFGQLAELALALTNDLNFEDSDGRVFNNILKYEEFLLAFEGKQPISILWHEVNTKLRRRINMYVVANSK